MNVEIKEGQWVFENESLKEMWKECYPAVDVERELKKAAAWALANPKNTKKNWQRFLVNWLSKAQEKAPAKGGATVQPKEISVVPCRECQGYGLVVHGNYAYRCRCANAERMSEKIRSAPIEAFNAPLGVMEQILYHKNPELLFKGFKTTGPTLKHLNAELYADVRRFFLDLFGKEEAVKKYHEAEKFVDIAQGKV